MSNAVEQVRFGHRGRVFRLMKDEAAQMVDIQQLSGQDEWTTLTPESALKIFTRIEIGFIADAMMAAGILGHLDDTAPHFFNEAIKSPIGRDYGFEPVSGGPALKVPTDDVSIDHKVQKKEPLIVATNTPLNRAPSDLN